MPKLAKLLPMATRYKVVTANENPGFSVAIQAATEMLFPQGGVQQQ
jgi:hypothetical protein